MNATAEGIGTALDWLAQVEFHPALSDDAKTVAAHLTDGWQGLGKTMRMGQHGIQKITGWLDRRRIWNAANELRRAGFLTGYGTRGKYYHPCDPVQQLPVIEAGRSAADLDAKLRALRGKR